MNKISVDTKEKLKELYNNSALTMTGLAESSIPDFLNWIKKLTPMKKEDVYVFSGKFMNDELHLTGTNRYPDDLTFVSVKLDDIENVDAVVFPRFQIGGRWLDDIINNDLSREEISHEDIETWGDR